MTNCKKAIAGSRQLKSVIIHSSLVSAHILLVTKNKYCNENWSVAQKYFKSRVRKNLYETTKATQSNFK